MKGGGSGGSYVKGPRAACLVLFLVSVAWMMNSKAMRSVLSCVGNGVFSVLLLPCDFVW